MCGRPYTFPLAFAWLRAQQLLLVATRGRCSSGNCVKSLTLSVSLPGHLESPSHSQGDHQARFCRGGLVCILWPPVSGNNSQGEGVQQMEGICGFSRDGMKEQPFLSSGDPDPLQNSISKNLAESLDQKNRKFNSCLFCCCSVAKSHLTLCDPPWTASLLCPTLSPRDSSNSCPLSQ